jgi:arylsulfatase A
MTMPRFAIVFLVLAAAWTAFLATAAAAEKERPNIVLIFTDDQGYGDVGCFGAQGFATPNMDRLAAEGMRFTDFYSGCPVCSGSRTALLTGCHYQRLSVPAVMFPGNKGGLHPNEVTIAEVLKPLGYATAIVGKWHLGHLPEFLPTRQGFDYYYGIPYSNDMSIDPVAAKFAAGAVFREGMTEEKARGETPKGNWVPLMRGEEVIEYPADQATLTRRYTEEAVRFLRENRDGPFFLYLPHTQPHLPLYASDAFKGRTKTLFGDVMEELDWSVGEILKTLAELKLDEKTLVIFTTDNGTRSGSSGPLRGQKASLYEGGYRVPCLMRWPKRIPAGSTCREITATIDVLPTLAAMTGGQLPSDRIIDGRDIRPLVFGEPGAKSPHEFYILGHGAGAVRGGNWKFYPWPEGGQGAGKKKGPPATPPAAGRPNVQLYDLAKDLSESTNVAADHPDVVKRLSEAYQRHMEDLKTNRRPLGQPSGGEE